MQLIYEVTEVDEILQDFQILKDGFRLLEYDYLGGNGSRGYGRIRVADLQVDVVIGEVEDSIIDKCQEILNS